MKKNHRIALEVKEQIIKRIKEEGVSVQTAAKDHGVSERAVYGWLSGSVKGMPTLGELVRLRRQNEELLKLVGELTLKMSETQKKS